MITLRGYQTSAVERLIAALDVYLRLVAIAPTGSGKTVVAAALIDWAVKQGLPCLFLAHRKELIDQTSAALDFAGIPHGVIMAGHYRNRPEELVQVASIDTLMSTRACPSCRGLPDLIATCPLCEGRGYERSRALPNAFLIIIDEGHRAMGNRYQMLIGHYPSAKIVLLTATPWRLDGKGLGGIVKEMVVIANMPELIAAGHLLPIRLFRWPEQLDLSGIAIRQGDYSQEQLGAVMRKGKLVGNIVDHYKELANGERAVAFASNVAHSIDIAARFVQSGIAAEHLDGSMAKGQREQILARLKNGQTRVVSNCDVLCEGFDLPSLHCVILARPTKSITRYLQQVGRSMRPFPGQEYALILDHANCRKEHGRPDDFHSWSLEDRRVGARAKIPSVSEPQACPNCNLDMIKGICARCSPQAFSVLFSEIDHRLVEDRAEPQQAVLPGHEQAMSRSERAQRRQRSDGAVLCSKCRQTWVEVRSGKVVKVTCHKCLENEKGL